VILTDLMHGQSLSKTSDPILKYAAELLRASGNGQRQKRLNLVDFSSKEFK